MTKTFEEVAQNELEQANNIYEAYQGRFKSEVPDGGLVVRIGDQILRFPWLEFAKNWHSDEEYQLLLRDRDTLKQGNDNLFKDHLEFVKENEELKSQLEHQPLPVVPEFVAEWIERLKTNDLKPLKNPETYGETGFTEEKLQNIVFWISENQEDYMRAWLDGYTVQKPKRFYLKNKLTTSYLILDTSTGYFEHWGSTEATGRYKSSFTQQEIDSMQTGSYELVPVEDGE